MRRWHKRLMLIAIAGIGCLPLVLASIAGQQTPAAATTYRAPRTADGKPNLNGIWQAINTANWDLQDHAAAIGQIPAAGTFSATPPGRSVVEGGEIPYKPEALAKKMENYKNRQSKDPDKMDPEMKCFLPGVPRATYMPYPFQIVQSSGTNPIMMVYEYAGGVRTINMGAPTKAPVDSWMGWSNGHWEGESLVVDVTAQREETWFDRAGDFHSDALHVVERYTAMSPEILNYEVTIDDPKTFTRQWKMSMPLYRHVEKNAQIMEFKCVEFVEELLYGQYRKQPNN
jgi:hypothetical protein